MPWRSSTSRTPAKYPAGGGKKPQEKLIGSATKPAMGAGPGAPTVRSGPATSRAGGWRGGGGGDVPSLSRGPAPRRPVGLADEQEIVHRQGEGIMQLAPAAERGRGDRAAMVAAPSGDEAGGPRL